MSSKYWIEQVMKKPAKEEKTGKRVRLAEMLLKMRKEKG
jgi:hypothetical protein